MTESYVERVLRLSSSAPDPEYIDPDIAWKLINHIELCLDEQDKVELSRRIKTSAGKIKYGGEIGDIIGEAGKSLAEQPKGFNMGALPEGSKIQSRVTGAKPYTKQKSGDWKHESGVVVSQAHFDKFQRTHELAHVADPVKERGKIRTSVSEIKDKLNKGLPIAKAEIYELARKFGEMDPEETLTKKDFVEHFIHEYLMSGGAAGAHGG